FRSPHRPPYQRPILGLFHHRPGPSPALPQPARSEPVRHVLAHAPGHRVDEETLAYALAHHQNGRRYTLVRREHAPPDWPSWAAWFGGHHTQAQTLDRKSTRLNS